MERTAPKFFKRNSALKKFEIGNTVTYSIHGVCVIEDIEKKDFMGSPAEYYVLKPVGDARSTVYVPCENGILTEKIKKVLSVSEIHELIKMMPNENDIWIDNPHERKKKYAEILSSGDRRALISLIKTLYERREKQKETGKKLHISDESFLRDAEKLLYEEFAHVLNIKKDQVLPFICSQIEVQEK